MSCPPSKPQGFTLLEVIVVLVILGLITTLLMQGLFLILHLRLGFLDQMDRQRVAAMQSSWIREVCGALTPDTKDGLWIFQGTSDGLRGLTLSTLTGEAGVPRPITIRIIPGHGVVILNYQEADGPTMELGRWPGTKGNLSYLDTQGRWLPQWPPGNEPANQIPEAIRLAVEGNEEPRVWSIPLNGRRNPRPNVLEIIEGL